MASGVITENGSGDWLVVSGRSVHLALSGDFGGGTIAIEQRIQGQAVSLTDSGSPISADSSVDVLINLRWGDVVRLVMSDATSPNVLWSLTDAKKDS